MFYYLIRKTLFHFDPERAHELILKQLNRVVDTPLEILIRQKVPEKPISCMGLTFKNPLGLASGLDKNGEYIDALGVMGFGFIEIGTVTPHPQPGNNKPRLFRIPEAEGLINRMGLNNYGVDRVVENIKKKNYSGILGVSIGKNKDTPIEKSKYDYLICMEKIYNYADYISINISSPNTAGLNELQHGKIMDDLLKAIKDKQNILNAIHNKYVPLVVKISPDLSSTELTKIVSSLIHYNIDGIIATNTTLDRSLVQGMNHYNEKGGLSGRPLQLKSTKTIQRLTKELNGQLPIIGVGGIDSVISAREKINAGAILIQIYSGLIYKGISLIKEIITHI